MTTTFQIPEISDAKLAILLRRLTPLVEYAGALWTIKLPDPRRVAFTWNPIRIDRALDLEETVWIRTLHRYGAPSFFKPSIAEVLAQIPSALVNWPGDLSSLAAFSVKGPDTQADLMKNSDALNAGFHVATTTLYRRSYP